MPTVKVEPEELPEQVEVVEPIPTNVLLMRCMLEEMALLVQLVQQALGQLVVVAVVQAELEEVEPLQSQMLVEVEVEDLVLVEQVLHM